MVQRGKGNGPAASALNPRPRDFTAPQGWKNGGRPTMVFKTLKEGLPPSAMASFVTLPADDRWALSHYVLSLAPNPEADAPGDFTKIGIDPNKEGGGATEAPTIPVALAMRRLTILSEGTRMPHAYHPAFDRDSEVRLASSPGAKIYQANCVQCHGSNGEGGVKVKNLGVNPLAYVVTQPFSLQQESLKSQEAFSKVVIQGLPGELMPGAGHLSGHRLRELYQFIKGLPAAH